MIKDLPIGSSDFRDLILKGQYYVDKTEMIENLLKQRNKVSLFPRPRRFGKSLFISMLDNFFNIEYKDTNKDLFNGLYICRSEYYNNLANNHNYLRAIALEVKKQQLELPLREMSESTVFQIDINKLSTYPTLV